MTIDIHNAEHYTWKDTGGAECDGWHLVKRPDTSVIFERMPSGTSETRHSHAKAWQFFFVISGELLVEVEGTWYELRPEQGIEIEPGRRHQVMNRGEMEATFLVISAPPSHGDRVEYE